ncbi:MAG TPA: hypothetical protein DIU00_19325 [Phycisphaerales bacterium]|nr:hypothetical protein [Phycisphaerales bacterium]
MLRQPGVQENNVPPKGEGRGCTGVLGALVVNHPLAPFRAYHEGLEELKEYRQEALFPDFPSKKFIKPPSFLTDKVLERDLNGIAQLQPGPAECERINNCKNLI